MGHTVAYKGMSRDPVSYLGDTRDSPARSSKYHVAFMTVLGKERATEMLNLDQQYADRSF